MKKLIKICAFTGLVLLVCGIGVTTITAAFGGRYSTSLPTRFWSRIWHNHMSWTDRWDNDWFHDWDDRWDGDWDGERVSDSGSSEDSRWRHWNEDELHVETHDTHVPGSGETGLAFDRVQKLDVDVDKGAIHITQQEGISQIQINVQDHYDKTQCYMDKSTLKIKRESKGNRSNDAPYIEVLVPAGYQFDKLSLDMGAAECQVINITTSKLDIDSGVGAISFTGTVNGDVEIETGVGDVAVNLTGPQSGYNYNVECGVGSISVGSEHYSLLSHETRINNNAPYNMELECGVGSITVGFDHTL